MENIFVQLDSNSKGYSDTSASHDPESVENKQEDRTKTIPILDGSIVPKILIPIPKGNVRTQVHIKSWLKCLQIVENIIVQYQYHVLHTVQF